MPNPRKRKRRDTPSDFQKKKAKVGKGKQPAENVTQLNFKSGSIVVPSQLADTGIEEPTTHRKLGFQALLTQLKHHNPSTRVSALHGLRDLLQSNPELLPPNLAKLVEQVMAVMVDHSAQVRHALSTLLSLIVSKTPFEKLTPFASLIVAHVTCALTHIDERVQIDSLKVLDLYAGNPLFIAPHVQTLLPLLVKLISRQEAFSSSKAMQASSFLGYFRGIISKQKGIFLASSPESKLADSSARLQIFLLFSKLLEAILGSHERESRSETTNAGPTIDIVNKRVSVPFSQASSTLVNLTTPIPHIPIFRSSGLYLPTIQSPNHLTAVESVLKSSDVSSWLKLIPSLLSLFLESWVDCSPSTVSSSSKALKKSTLMDVILRLILSTLHLARILQRSLTGESSDSSPRLDSIFAKFWSEFQTHFLSHSPFSTKPCLSGTGSFLTTFDLRVCLITKELLELVSSIDAQNKKIALNGLCTFLSSLSSVKVPGSGSKKLNTQEFQTCVHVFTQVYPFLISCHLPSEVVSCESLSRVTQSLWRVYEWAHPQSQSKQLLHQCFGNLLQSDLRRDLRLMVMAELLLPWLQNVPKLLGTCEDVNVVTLLLEALVGGVASRCHRELSEEMEKIVMAVFGYTQLLRQLPSNTQRQCVALVWQIPAQTFFRSKGLVIITQAVQCEALDLDVAVYLIQTVHHKFSHLCSTEAQVLTAGLYFSFMLSLIIGHSREELQQFSTLEPITRFVPPLFSLVQSERPLCQSYRSKVTKTVCDCLCVSSMSPEALHVMEQRLISLSEALLCIPIEAAASLLTLGVRLVPVSVPAISEQLSLFFARLSLSILVTKETTLELSKNSPTICKLANQILEYSELICNSLLLELPHQLSREQESGSWSVVSAILKVLVSMASSRLVQSSETVVQSIRSTVREIAAENVNVERSELVAQLRIMQTNLGLAIHSSSTS